MAGTVRSEETYGHQLERSDSTGEQQAMTLFKPGQSGNPTGRPKGSKNKLAEDFIKALSDDFAAHGVAAIEKVRAERPDQYLKLVADMIPKDMRLSGGFDTFPAGPTIIFSGAPDNVSVPQTGLLALGT